MVFCYSTIHKFISVNCLNNLIIYVTINVSLVNFVFFLMSNGKHKYMNKKITYPNENGK